MFCFLKSGTSTHLRESRPRRQRQMNSRGWWIQSGCCHWCMIQFIVPSVWRCNAFNFVFLLDDTLTNSSGWAFVFCWDKTNNDSQRCEYKFSVRLCRYSPMMPCFGSILYPKFLSKNLLCCSLYESMSQLFISSLSSPRSDVSLWFIFPVVIVDGNEVCSFGVVTLKSVGRKKR